MKNALAAFCFCFASLWLCGQGGDRPLPEERNYYRITDLPLPEGVVMEVGGLAMLPNGSLAAATRRGEVWVIQNPQMANGEYPHYTRFASGLHEALGLAYKNGSFLLAQRGELTRLTDRNGDGRADAYETIYAWPLSGHYHEYSFGPVIADNGDMYVTANVAFGDREWWRGESRVPWRGWTMQISQDGIMSPYATGMRSPCALGIVDGEFFYADNQGDWIGSGGLVHLERGDFAGHPAGLRWAERPESPVQLTTNDVYYRASPRFTPPGQDPVKPENIADEVPLPFFALQQELPAVKPPAVWLPHGLLGLSTSEIKKDETGGAFGPFTGQLFIGDQGQSKIVRVFLEKVNGVYQGAAFNFVEGFQSGVLRMAWGHDGTLYVGQTSRGWGATGSEPYGLQKLTWTGETPFEMKEVHAKPDGFEITFTQPVDKATALDPTTYEITGFTYKYHPVYGSPVVNDQNCPIRGLLVADDGLSVRLIVDSLRQYYIHEIKADSLRAYAGHLPLLHPAAYYTLNEIPTTDRQALTEADRQLALNTVSDYWAAVKKKKEEAQKMAAHSHTPSHNQATPKPKVIPKPKPKPKRSTPKYTTRPPSTWAGQIDKSLSISTLPGMRYDQGTLSVKAGSKVKLTFYNNDDMPHNIVFTAPNKADAVGMAAMKLGLKGQAMQYVPKSSNVLYHSGLVGPGASESIYFTAPKQAGLYEYVCTFPGHYKSMRGKLRVF